MKELRGLKTSNSEKLDNTYIGAVPSQESVSLKTEAVQCFLHTTTQSDSHSNPCRQ
jgi:hypothetical protein